MSYSETHTVPDCEYDVLNVYEFFVYYIFDRVDLQLRMIRYSNDV